MVELHPSKVDVVSSSLISRSIAFLSFVLLISCASIPEAQVPVGDTDPPYEIEDCLYWRIQDDTVYNNEYHWTCMLPIEETYHGPVCVNHIEMIEYLEEKDPGYLLFINEQLIDRSDPSYGVYP